MTKPSADSPVRRALLDSEKPEKRGSNLACLKCRAIKVKCSRANIEDDRCKRCTRLNFVCEFKEHHRGRKPKKRPRSEADSTGADEEDQLEDDEAEAASFSAKTNASSPARVKMRELSRSPPPRTPPFVYQQAQAYQKSEASRFDATGELPPRLPSPKGSVHGRWFGPYLQPIPSFEDSLFPRKPQSHSVAPHLQQQQHSDQHQQSQNHHHSYHHDRRRELPPLSVPSAPSSSRNGLSPIDHGHWDRTLAWNSAQSNMQRSHASTSAAAAPPTMAADLRDDAVHQHVISMDQAHELFEYYFAELNPPLALLDTALHTVEHCRQHAPILFSTIISVASRFFQPQLHRQCHRIAKAVLNLAAAEEICTLDHIQALILVITWKDPGDRTILRKANRAIGYAYELGLHASFDGMETANAIDARAGSEGNRARSDSYSHRYKRRLERDRQRTWIVLCLVHELVRRDDRNSKPRARIIPLEDYPDPYIWIKQGGEVLLSVDSRLAWSLGMSILTLESEPFLDLINRSEDATPFAGVFERYRSRLDKLRHCYFDVRDGVFHPKFPMDKSAVAELPYIDAFRDYYICQSTWHWAAKVASQSRTRRSELAEQQATSRSAFWFAQTVDAAMRCLRLFVYDLCKPGYVRVGHDYLVITASEVTKWFYLYRDHLDASTLMTGVEYLRATLRECSQPQRLASGEVVDTEREAPGYLVRFIEAIFDAGLNQSYEKAKGRLAASVERFRSKPHQWGEQYGASGGGVGRDRSLTGGATDDYGMARREIEAGQSNSSSGMGGPARRPPWIGAHASYQGSGGGGPERSSAAERTMGTNVTGGSPPFRDVASATARYSTAPSLPRGRSELGLNRIPSHPAAGVTSFERGGGGTDKAETLESMFNGPDAAMAAPTSGFNPASSVAPHPAYLASSGQAGNEHAALTSPFAGGAPSWSSSAVAPSSWNANEGVGINTQLQQPDGGLVGLGGGPGAELATMSATLATNSAASPTHASSVITGMSVVPIAAEIGKNSIEGLAACLNTRDLTYWQDMLGFDLGNPAL